MVPRLLRTLTVIVLSTSSMIFLTSFIAGNFQWIYESGGEATLTRFIVVSCTVGLIVSWLREEK